MIIDSAVDVEPYSDTPESVKPPFGNPRFPEIDALRAIAALSVLLFHLTQQGYLQAVPGLAKITAHLNGGVPLFFVVSGFVLFRPYLASVFLNAPPITARGYAARRALRIVPAYWLCLLVAGAVVSLPGVFGHHFFIFFLFLQVYSAHFNGRGLPVAWSLCTEMSFYLLLPVIAAGLPPLARRFTSNWHWMLAAGLGAVATASVAFHLMIAHGSHAALGTSILGSFYLFWAGMMVAVVSVRSELDYRWKRLSVQVGRYAWASWVLALGLFVAIAESVSPSNSGPVWPPYGVIGVLLVLPAALGLQLGSLRTLLRLRGLAFLGAISYGIYLWHVPVIVFLGHQLGIRPPSTGSLLVILSLVPTVTVLLSWLSYRFLEAPLLRIARRVH